MSDEKRKPLLQRSAFNYFKRLSEKKEPPEDEFFILNDEEREKIRQVRIRAMLLAALTGALAVAVYYIPHFLFKDFIAGFVSSIWLFGYKVEINLLSQGYSLFLVFLEIFILTRINIWAVAETANACRFPDRREPQYFMHLEQLFNLGTDKKNTGTLKFGINPFEGMPRFYLFAYTVWNMLKATLTNFVVKLVVVKVVARAELRQYADLVGIPVFAIWNAGASFRILENARVYIMAPGVINQFAAQLRTVRSDPEFRQNVFDALQYVVSLKRSYHHNHFLLVQKLIDIFELQNFKDGESDLTAFLDKVKASSPEVKKAYSKLLVLGIFIDGSISMRERGILNNLYKEGVINLNPRDAHIWCRRFRRGQGLQDFMNA